VPPAQSLTSKLSFSSPTATASNSDARSKGAMSESPIGRSAPHAS
jgi:hypothetical protein